MMGSRALVAGCAGVLALAASSASAADGATVPAATAAACSTLLGGSCRRVVQRIERAKADRVRQALDLRFGNPGRYLTAQQLRIALGGRVSMSGSDEVLETVEIRAPQGVQESPLGASIPFGVAGIVWGVRHPAEAWRLIVPVLE